MRQKVKIILFIGEKKYKKSKSPAETELFINRYGLEQIWRKDLI